MTGEAGGGLDDAAELCQLLTKEALKAFDASTVASMGRFITRVADASKK